MNTEMIQLETLASSIHAWAVRKGFYENERNEGEIIALMHSELSEMLEALRDDDPPSEQLPRFSSMEIEAADLMIRLLDFAHVKGWCLSKAIRAKMVYNEGRPYKHGRVRF